MSKRTTLGQLLEALASADTSSKITALNIEINRFFGISLFDTLVFYSSKNGIEWIEKGNPATYNWIDIISGSLGRVPVPEGLVPTVKGIIGNAEERNQILELLKGTGG